MILGIGTDIASIERIGAALDRHGGRFEARTFTPEEIALANSRPANRAATLAKRWAAKEACAKALGCGIAQGIALTDIAVARDGLGAPSLVLSGGAAERLAAITPAGHTARLHLSLSDDAPFALAYVMIEAIAIEPCAPPAI